MDINEPLHGQIYLWMIAAVIVLGYADVVGNKYWAKRHVEDRRATVIVLTTVLIMYGLVYSYLTFFYREPMTEAHVRLELFWSYREAFDGMSVRRLGVARSIVLNIAITIPLGYLLPSVYRFTKRRYLWTMVTVLCLSIATEVVQGVSRTGLAETDDVINNLIGAEIGVLGYWLANKVLERRAHDKETDRDRQKEVGMDT